MDSYFSQFCLCGQAGYAQLKSRTDACAVLGRSYEFPGCHMPGGCTPARACVSFWRNKEEYLLYLTPNVVYQGQSRPLTEFFRTRLHRYPDFQALVRQLQSLGKWMHPQAADPMPPLLKQLAACLGETVIGQEQAVESVAFKLYGHISKRNPARPLSLILHGPTGVGKSELGKSVAPVLNRCCAAQRYAFVWTELNTFTQPHSVYRLTGAPPGYVGYDDHPIFEAVLHNPNTVFMFDELEKAHPEVLKVFMSILDEGRCAARRENSTGSRELDFRRCIFLFTTNADLSGMSDRRLGFTVPAPGAPPTPPQAERRTGGGMAALAQRVFEENERGRQALVRTGVLQEIAGRFSGIVGFQSLDGDARSRIAAKQVAALGREYGLEITQVSPEIIQALLGCSQGADVLSVRSVVSIIEGALTDFFLSQAGRYSGRPVRLMGTLEHKALQPDAARSDGLLLPAF